jgi:hypothetical protein
VLTEAQPWEQESGKDPAQSPLGVFSQQVSTISVSCPGRKPPFLAV